MSDEEMRALAERLADPRMDGPMNKAASDAILSLMRERDEARSNDAALVRFQDEVWGAFQTWSMALGWGLTGNQPECYAMMDTSIDRMLSAEARAEAAESRLARAKAALREIAEHCNNANGNPIVNERVIERIEEAALSVLSDLERTDDAN